MTAVALQSGISSAATAYRAPALPPRVREVVEQCAARHGLSVADLLSGPSTRPLLAARRECWATLHAMTRPDGRTFSLPQIGRWFGAHHTTVLQGIRCHAIGRDPRPCSIRQAPPPPREALANQVLEQLKPDLEATGFPWSIERGGKHLKLRVAGRLVGVMPEALQESDGRPLKNFRAQIRRMARQLRT